MNYKIYHLCLQPYICRNCVGQKCECLGIKLVIGLCVVTCILIKIFFFLHMNDNLFIKSFCITCDENSSKNHC